MAHRAAAQTIDTADIGAGIVGGPPFSPARTPRAVRCVFSDQFAATCRRLQDEAHAAADGLRLVIHECERIPPAGMFLDEVIRTLAEAAGMLWPEWYDGSIRLDDGDTLGEREVSQWLASRQIRRSNQHVHLGWLRAAIAACRGGRLPIVSHLPAPVRAAQLSLALAERELMLAVTVGDPSPASGDLLGLARGLEWLARRTGVEVVAVLPTELASRVELDTFPMAPFSSGRRHRQAMAGNVSRSPSLRLGSGSILLARSSVDRIRPVPAKYRLPNGSKRIPSCNRCFASTSM